MKEIFVNLKRFDVPRKFGGICPKDAPAQWIREIIRETVRQGIGKMQEVSVVYFLPEALLVPAAEALNEFPAEDIGDFRLGCQGVFRQDVETGRNFGAFTANRPAAAMRALDCQWVMVGHSEERKDKLEMFTYYDKRIEENEECGEKAAWAVDALLNEEIKSTLKRDMNVLLCIGETQLQKGSETPQEYEPRVKEVLKQQITRGFKEIGEVREGKRIAIGYEPVWAIGPGKTPPGAAYIRFVSKFIKEVCRDEFQQECTVVYGGGLKEENAAEIAAVPSIDGGLVGLTRFEDPIGFDVNSLRKIIQAYIK